MISRSLINLMRSLGQFFSHQHDVMKGDDGDKIDF